MRLHSARKQYRQVYCSPQRSVPLRAIVKSATGVTPYTAELAKARYECFLLCSKISSQATRPWREKACENERNLTSKLTLVRNLQSRRVWRSAKEREVRAVVHARISNNNLAPQACKDCTVRLPVAWYMYRTAACDPDLTQP